MSRINPCSSLSVILSIRWSSSKTTWSIGIRKNGSELHPGWLDHDLTMVLAIGALAKNSHECDMLHLKPNKSGTVGYALYLVSMILIIIYEVRFFNSYTGYMCLYVKVSKKSLPLFFMDLAPNTAVIRSGSFHAHGNKQPLTYQKTENAIHLIISSQEEFKLYCLPIDIYLFILY